MTVKTNVLNLNVGVLGHIDSGKTTLTKALSTTASTASFDKNPQSQERGITIDLGFSSLSVPLPDHLKTQSENNPLFQDINTLQFTFVDCPGHASLIKTIIGGAQIIDMMMLVIDVMKGIQTQTAECLVIGEITCDKMIVVLNKIDLIEESKRASTVEKVTKRISKTLEKTKFSNSPIVAVSAKHGDETEQQPLEIHTLLQTLSSSSFFPQRSNDGAFMMLVDHCFSIRGQGTVLTGTVVQGAINLNDSFEIPTLKTIKKVKSMQMFKKPISGAIQGDRIGICVTQLDAKQIERGIICAPNFMTLSYAAIATVKRIPYFKGQCFTKSKFHISVMHATVMAKAVFFNGNIPTFDLDQEYSHSEELSETDEKSDTTVYVLLQFEQPVVLHEGALYISSKLDSDISANLCRIAFYGKILTLFHEKSYETSLSSLKVYKFKSKEGIVDRVANQYEVIVKNMFKKETDIQRFVGLKVKLSSGEEGIIDGTFGQTGKIKIRVPNGLMSVPVKGSFETIRVQLLFKRFIYDSQKKILQTN